MAGTRDTHANNTRASKLNGLQHHPALDSNKAKWQEEAHCGLLASQPTAEEASEVQSMQLDNIGEHAGQKRLYGKHRHNKCLQPSSTSRECAENRDQNSITWNPPHQCPSIRDVMGSLPLGRHDQDGNKTPQALECEIGRLHG